MKTHQYINTTLLAAGILFAPAALAGEDVTVGVVPDKNADAPAVERVKGENKKVEKKTPILFAEDIYIPEEDLWPALYEVMRDRDRDPMKTFLELLTQRTDWSVEELTEAVRDIIIANPSLTPDVQKILEEAGIPEDIIHRVIENLINDGSISDNGSPIIPTPPPTSEDK